MKRVVIIQARMTSTRLPGKVLADLAGRPLLAQQIARLRASRETDDIVIATTVNASDDPLQDLARKEGVRWFRGDEQDVLSRYAGAAREARADLVVRITSDCPLVDAAEMDRVIRDLREHATEADYAANTLERSYPRGLDTEAFFRDTLERVDRLGRSREAREHVTWLIHRERPELFVRRSVRDAEDNSDLRWTVDTPEDLEVVRKIFAALNLGTRAATYREVLAYVRAHPELSAGNAHIAQKES
ncbi:MAG: glycosyltransferase family protein [Planctomycetes bacterium]|nr:glycosyltransferase family protein [Planctomycetota bacterium]